ncbi:MAG: asparagine synthase (glutamine-hydrolyzing) [Alphaproteobacteria bacterium]|nr:asparagine synthase (glutamine-hydrolyzing) [Alphaproteobacteria bacterium]
MCGIVGMVDRRGASAETLTARVRAMMDAIRHRGPDDDGDWVDSEAGAALGFRRLAIIDLSPGGHQPMASADGRFVAVYNGEIYNYRELKAELSGLGHRFQSTSDTEVMLAAVGQWGPKAAIQRLVGMFAITLWDRENRTLTLARDRLGEKPVHYSEANGLFLFGSELKALRAHPDCPAAIDAQALSHFFRRAYVPAPLTIYAGVKKLPPGHILTLAPGKPADVEPYWSLAEVAARPRAAFSSEEEAVERLDALLRDAVSRATISDRPLGVLLSGGIDSSTVAAVMQATSTAKVKSFTIGFGEASHDESGHAEAVARHLGTDHVTLTATAADALALVPDMAQIYDEPFADSSQVPTYMVSRLARAHVVVALSGDGGDEVFAGYNRHVALAQMGAVLDLPKSVRGVVASLAAGVPPSFWDRAASFLPESVRPREIGDTMQKLAGILGAEDADAMHERLLTQWQLPPVAAPYPPPAPPGAALADPLERMQLRDSLDYLPDDILVKVDRASMAVGLETRAPLLDYRLVELAWRLPRSMRVRGSSGKWALRRVLERYVPRALTDRPKTGFALPLADWLRGPLRDWAEPLLAAGALHPALDADPIRAAWEDHLAGRQNHQHRLWCVLMFQAWSQRWA